ncbi:MAG: hypothetical protein WA941_12320 [Nitrososphaeraceae archaeon]
MPGYTMQHTENQLYIYMVKIKTNNMMEIELELTSNSKNVTEILEKVSQLVRKSQELGFEIKELEIESEHDKKDKEGIEKE